MASALHLDFLVRKLKRRLLILSEKASGFDFTAYMSNEDTGVPASVGVFHAASDKEDLKMVLKQLHIKSSESILDVGCGKGSAMNTMRSFPFKAIHGVELSQVLFEIARRNFDILGDNRIELFLKDAREFTRLSPYTYFYFYHPFPPDIMRIVLENIKESIIRNPRKTYLIYHNPACGNVIEEAGFTPIDQIKGKEHTFVIYRN